MQKIISMLQTQGGKNVQAVFNALVKSGLATEEASPRNVAALIVAVTAPHFVPLEQYVLDRLNATTEDGDTFGDALKEMFEIKPEKLAVASITIVHHAPWTKISGFKHGQCYEFCGSGHQPQGIRTETVISGGTITAISIKLNGPATAGGWTGATLEG